MHSLLKYEKSDIEYSHKFNTWASITESNGHPPPRKILDRGSPPQEGDSLANYSPF